MKSYNELVKPIKFIELDDLCELIGIPYSCSPFLSTTNSANDNYVSIDCSDYYLEELEDNFNDDEAMVMREMYGSRWREKYNNEIKLIKILRDTYGIRDTVLTYVSW